MSLIISTGCMNKKIRIIPSGLHIKTTIVDIIINDLGQVMIFTEDSKNKKIVFIKDFYMQNISQEELHAQMEDFIKPLKKMAGKYSDIEFSFNDNGDKTISSIHEIELDPE